MKTLPPVALGTWSWGIGFAGGDTVFGNHLSEAQMAEVFSAAMSKSLNLWDTVLPQLEKLTAAMKSMGAERNASAAQIAIAWAIAKGTLPLVGATKVQHVLDAADAAEIQLSNEEIILLERLAAETGVDTRGAWEKPML
jgi:Predicted oxidoreductases (related to aryl-alcohol dehydrogenases)